MQQPPPHGYHGGYPQPPYPPPYGGGGFTPPPPKSGPSVAVIVLIVVVALLVVGGGGCLVCAVIVAKSADKGEPTSPESTLDRSPLSRQLDTALRKDGIPFDHVECPVTPPRTGSFSCAVLPSENGDPAEVIVTMGATGMAYKLQEGFVILEGPKLAALFATQQPRLTAPCFRTPKIMKHVDSAFTCEAMQNGTVTGLVTTTVLTRTGQVKLDYAPR